MIGRCGRDGMAATLTSLLLAVSMLASPTVQAGKSCGESTLEPQELMQALELAYPFDLTHQNSNQWALELLSHALSSKELPHHNSGRC